MSIRRTIKAELYRLGLHASTQQIVDALKAKGMHVGSDLVKQVKIELLKETNTRAADAQRQGNRSPDRHRQKIPVKRPGRR